MELFNNNKQMETLKKVIFISSLLRIMVTIFGINIFLYNFVPL